MSRTKNRKHIYCSNKCKFEASETIELTPCYLCNKLIKPKNYLRNKVNFCSKKCTDKHKANTYKRDLEYNIDSNGCHVIMSHFIQPNGYVSIKRSGIAYTAHRYIYELHKGQIPLGKVVRHTCDNKLCINPNHLIVGTYKENMQDAVRRKRMSCGEKHYNSKLKEKEVIQILKLNKEGKSNKEIGDLFKVDRRTISHVLNGESWKHLKQKLI